MATLETLKKEQAFLLETAVLHCCRNHRLGTRELVRLPAEQIIEVAIAAARALGLEVCLKRDPQYAPRDRPKKAGAPPLPEDLVPSDWAASKGLVEGLTVPPARVPQTLPQAPDEAPPQAPDETPAKVAGKPSLDDPGDVDDVLDEVDARSPCDTGLGLAEASVAAPLEPRGYQSDAIDSCVAELDRQGLAVLQMACRCGKTAVAYGVVRAVLDKGPGQKILYLVPGLSLLRQTAAKLAGYGLNAPMFLVGSDPRPIAVGARELLMSTSPRAVGRFLESPESQVVLSTYQSSAQVPGSAFTLTVFDESHRVCGGAVERPFNHTVLSPRTGARLFMTATPAYEGALSMKDREVFGGVAYRYHLRQGISAGYVNDFRLELIAASAAEAGREVTEEEALPAQIQAAMSRVDKLLVFCRNIGHASQLCASLKELVAAETGAPECLLAHSRQRPGEAAAALKRFAAQGTRAVLFNCRLFQEGVEVPALNAVMFAAPRHSPRDIIQSVCRPLNKVPGKPVSVVFLPVLSDPGLGPEDPANLKRYATIVPFIDALLDEDPRLYDHLLDPRLPYPIDLLGTHSLGLPKDPKDRAQAQAALLSAVKRVVRHGTSTAARKTERLLRVEMIPWQKGFNELKRVVDTCGRYPKTTDLMEIGKAKTSLHKIYRSYADKWKRWQAGDKEALEPFQAKALEELPGWLPYGVDGPYAWAPCIAFLEEWLGKHKGRPPMLNVNNGGYIGLEATMVERLSGLLTCINQGDGKARKGGSPGSGFTIDPAKQKDMDRVCAQFGLRWRKDRGPDGGLVKGGPRTFIQEAHARFKARLKKYGSGDPLIQRYYPGYPMKHKRMERLDVKSSQAPPRRPKKVGAVVERVRKATVTNVVVKKPARTAKAGTSVSKAVPGKDLRDVWLRLLSKHSGRTIQAGFRVDVKAAHPGLWEKFGVAELVLDGLDAQGPDVYEFVPCSEGCPKCGAGASGPRPTDDLVWALGAASVTRMGECEFRELVSEGPDPGTNPRLAEYLRLASLG